MIHGHLGVKTMVNVLVCVASVLKSLDINSAANIFDYRLAIKNDIPIFSHLLTYIRTRLINKILPHMSYLFVKTQHAT
jgi:hypothetical protein